MNNQKDMDQEQFLAVVSGVRPKLHRYCSRMMGSVLDGEDLVQETLVQAFSRLSQLEQGRPLEPWLFRIAHNKYIDFLRRQRLLMESLEAEHHLEENEMTDSFEIEMELSQEVEQALHLLVNQLPPMERACLILKEVLDYSLQEISEIAKTTPGAVKSALHRGREKLKKLKKSKRAVPSKNTEKSQLLAHYVERFNRQDWAGLKELIQEDVSLEVVGLDKLKGRDTVVSNYFRNYSRLEIPWRFTLGQLDGEEVLICWRYIEETWIPQTAARLEVTNRQVTAIKDYIHVEYLLENAEIVSLPPLD